MVGNVAEWVADWVPRSTACTVWSAGVSPTADAQCLNGAGFAEEPGVLVQGGSDFDGTSAGPLMVEATFGPSFAVSGIGFRCVH